MLQLRMHLLAPNMLSTSEVGAAVGRWRENGFRTVNDVACQLSNDSSLLVQLPKIAGYFRE